MRGGKKVMFLFVHIQWQYPAKTNKNPSTQAWVRMREPEIVKKKKYK